MFVALGREYKHMPRRAGTCHGTGISADARRSISANKSQQRGRGGTDIRQSTSATNRRSGRDGTNNFTYIRRSTSAHTSVSFVAWGRGAVYVGQLMGTVHAPPAVLASAASAAAAPVVSVVAPPAAMASATSTAVVSAAAPLAVLASATSTAVVSAAAHPAALPPVVFAPGSFSGGAPGSFGFGRQQV